MSWIDGTVAGDHTFACCLTHDIDRPYKTYQALYYALTERDPSHLLDLLPDRNPYWTFEEILSLEKSLGVRSSWYVLDEQSLLTDRPLQELFDSAAWQLYAGRYSLSDPEIRDLVVTLDQNGWEVGLHGSYESYRDASLLASEKAKLEELLGHEVTGVRQHYLNLDRPGTWERQRAVGFEYDATPGSSRSYGFGDGYDPFCPFDNDFLVFPVTIMEEALPDPGDNWDRARAACDRLLREAAENRAVLSLLWHPRYFSDDFPGYQKLYRHCVEQALDLGAWVGPVGDLYDSCSTPNVTESKVRADGSSTIDDSSAE